MSLSKSIKTRFVVWVWNHTPNCAEMSRLAARSLEQPATAKTWLKMRLHFLICAWCRRYFRQLRFLHAAAPRLEWQTGGLPGRGMSAEAKRRIIARILASR